MGLEVYHHRCGMRGVEPVLAATKAVELRPAGDTLVRARAIGSGLAIANDLGLV